MMPASRSFFLALFQRVGKERFVEQVEDQISFSAAGVGNDAYGAFLDECSSVVDGAVIDDINLHLPTFPFKV